MITKANLTYSQAIEAVNRFMELSNPEKPPCIGALSTARAFVNEAVRKSEHVNYALKTSEAYFEDKAKEEYFKRMSERIKRYVETLSRNPDLNLPRLNDSAKETIRKGNLIDAIKEYRQDSGTGLLEACHVCYSFVYSEKIYLPKRILP